MSARTAALLSMLFLSAACFTDPPPKTEIRYARRKINLPAGVSFKYGQSIEFASCSPAACYGTVAGKAISVPLDEIQEMAPLKGPVYVWDDDNLDGQTLYEIDDYHPAQARFHLPDVDRWIETDSLRDRPESPQERESRRAAKEAAEAQRTQREKDQEVLQAKEAKDQAGRDRAAQEANRQEARRMAPIEEAGRREYARLLRDNYLAAGSDIKVTVSGRRAEKLTLEYPLINDVWLYKFQHDDEAMSALRSKGFTHLTLSDGFNYAMRITL